MKYVWIYDIEIFINFFCVTFMNRDTKEVKIFIIHTSKNDLQILLNFLRNDVSGLIGFNNIGFDYPLIHMLLINKQWINYNSDEITKNLYSKAKDIINNQDNNKFINTIPEWNMIIPQLDLYKINHYDNAAKRQSLKGIEIAIKFDNVDDLPFHFNHLVIDEEINRILSYNLNDVKATYEFYKLCIDKIELRKELSKEYDINLLNANDPKIGSEIFASLLSKEMDIDIKSLKQMRTYRDKILLSDVILPYIKFDNKQFNDLLNTFKSQVVTETKNSIEYSVIYNGFKFDYGLGGIHGCIKPGKYKNDEDNIIIDLDVASFYPNLAIVNEFKPKHLGEAFSTIYKHIYDERSRSKKGSAKNAGLKLALNGSYGKSNDINSFLYDPQFTMSITVNGQLLLTMLAEKLIDQTNCTTLQVNTDGLTIKVNKDKQPIINEIIDWWQKLTGLQLESNYYNLMIIRDVNNYIARYTNNKVKYKGAFEIVKELHKDSSMTIVPIALSEYFLNNKPIQETIKNHKDIFDFCKRFKATEGWRSEYRYINLQTYKIESEIQQKNIRYYISTNGSTLMKVHIDNREINIEKGYICTIFNKYQNLENYNIDYKYYIDECNKIINEIEDKQLLLW